MAKKRIVGFRADETSKKRIEVRAKEKGFSGVSAYLMDLIEQDLDPKAGSERLALAKKGVGFPDEQIEDLLQGLFQVSKKVEQVELKLDGYLGRTFKKTRHRSNQELLEESISALAFYRDKPQTELVKYLRDLFKDVKDM